jgi:hypothetical protein
MRSEGAPSLFAYYPQSNSSHGAMWGYLHGIMTKRVFVSFYHVFLLHSKHCLNETGTKLCTGSAMILK